MEEVTSSSNCMTFNKSDTPKNKPKEILKADHTNFILEILRQNQPISLYDLEKLTATPHSTLFYIMRDMEFAGLVYSKKHITKQNRIVRLFRTSKKYSPQARPEKSGLSNNEINEDDENENS